MARRWPLVLALAAALIVALSHTWRASAATVNCTAQQLSASASFGAETGSEVGGISLRNRGPSVCLLPRRTNVAVYWKQQKLRLRDTAYSAYQPDKGRRRIGSLKPGQWSFVPLWWSNWCGARPWGKDFFRPTFLLTLGDSTTLTVALRHGAEIPPPRCDAPKLQTSFEVGAFYTPLPVGWIP